MGDNVGQILRQGALAHPTRTALVEWSAQGERRELDYATLDLRARRGGWRVSASARGTARC